MYHFTYKTTNTETGQYYIGVHSTSNLNDGYLGSGHRLRAAINKYGEDSFDRQILEFFDSRELALAHERELVTERLIADPQCYNLAIGNGYKKEGNAGRKYGSKNSGYTPKKGWSRRFLIENAHRLDEIFDSVKSPSKKVDMYLKLLPIVLGKLEPVEPRMEEEREMRAKMVLNLKSRVL